MSEIKNQTKNCIICTKNPPKVITGHVIDVDNNRESILAGFCEEHEHWTNLSLVGEGGCYGYYHEKFGKKPLNDDENS